MSERDDGWKVVIVGLVLAVLFLAVCCQQYASWIKDLQRRVGQLEATTEVKE